MAHAQKRPLSMSEYDGSNHVLPDAKRKTLSIPPDFANEVQNAISSLETSNAASPRVVTWLRLVLQHFEINEKSSSKRMKMPREQAQDIFNQRPTFDVTDKIRRGTMSDPMSSHCASELANRYGVTVKTIRDIWRGRTWRDLDHTTHFKTHDQNGNPRTGDC